MANVCSCEMRVVGKKENVEEFIRMMEWKDEFKDKGLGRVFEVTVYDMEALKEDYVSYSIDLDCAWSIKTALVERPIGLESETKRLKLALEAYSCECGFSFQEHYLVVNGKILCDECKDWNEYDINVLDEKELQDISSESGCSIKDIKVIAAGNDGFFSYGGFDDFGDFYASDYLLRLLSE